MRTEADASMFMHKPRACGYLYSEYRKSFFLLSGGGLAEIILGGGFYIEGDHLHFWTKVRGVAYTYSLYVVWLMVVLGFLRAINEHMIKCGFMLLNACIESS